MWPAEARHTVTPPPYTVTAKLYCKIFSRLFSPESRYSENAYNEGCLKSEQFVHCSAEGNQFQFWGKGQPQTDVFTAHTFAVPLGGGGNCADAGIKVTWPDILKIRHVCESRCWDSRQISAYMEHSTVDPRVTAGLTYEQLGLRPKF
jgi:hypothetical protein